MPKSTRQVLTVLAAFLSCRLIAGAVITSPRLERLRAAIAAEPDAVSQFWREVESTGTPIIEKVPDDEKNVLVTFLWRGDATVSQPVVFASTLPENDLTRQRLTHLAGTDVWYRTYKFPRNVPILYELSPAGPERLQRDPLNPRSVEGPMGGSAVILPAVRNQELVEATSSFRGTLESSTFASKHLGNERPIRVYLPAGFERGKDYDVILVLDEDVYTGPVRLPTILDNLIATRQIRPVVAILVGNTNRAVELSCSAQFSRFLATELLPSMEERYGFRRRRERTTVVGSSLGGLAAACAGLYAADQIGGVIALSGSFRWRPPSDSEPEWLARQLAVLPPTRVRFFVGVGSYETGTPNEPANPSLLTAARHLRDVLRARAYDLTYEEFPGAHEPLSWRSALPDAIRLFHQ